MSSSTSSVGSSAYLKIRNLSKQYGPVEAVSKINLDIMHGEFFCLLGGSGSGKSTLLRLIAGLEKPNSGRIVIEGQDISSTPPWKRPVSMMFQSYALFPHMSVAKNIAYGLRHSRFDGSAIKDRVKELLELVQLQEFDHRKPSELSGGQRQRVALARALARNPKVLLLDEPLSALDKKLREETQRQLIAIHREIGTTFIMVTHDQEEAMSNATRIGVMDEGRLIQVDTPKTLYDRPENTKVAGFIGQINLFEASAIGYGDAQKLSCRDLPGPIEIFAKPELQDGQEVWIAIRPECISISPKTGEPVEGRVNSAAGRLTEIRSLGGNTIFLIELESGNLARVSTAQSHDDVPRKFSTGDPVEISFERSVAVLLEA